MTNWTNVTSPTDLLAIPNTNTGGSFWVVVLYMIWIVLTIAFSVWNIEVALLASTFIAMVASLFLTYAGLIAWEWTLFFIGFLLFWIIYIIWSSSKDQ